MHKKNRLSALLLAATAAGSLLLTACAGGGADEAPDAGAGGEADIAGAQAQLDLYSPTFTWEDPGPEFDASGAAGATVAYIPLDNAIPIFSVIYGELETALGEVGAQSTLCDGKGQPSQWAACIDDAAGRGADVIILDSIPIPSVQEAVDAARAAGVKIIDGNNGDPGFVPEGADARVSFQYSLSGRLVSDWIITDSKGDANVLIIQSPESGNVPDLVDNGYVAELEEKCPGCTYKVVDVAIADWATKLQSTVQAQLASDPSIDYIIPIYDGASTYIVPGIQAAGAVDSVKVATFNANLDPMKKLAAGESIHVEVGSHNAYEGWAYADQALRLINGVDPVENELIPARVFTEKNIGEIELTPEAERSGVWFGDDTYQGEFKRLWGLG